MDRKCTSAAVAAHGESESTSKIMRSAIKELLGISFGTRDRVLVELRRARRDLRVQLTVNIYRLATLRRELTTKVSYVEDEGSTFGSVVKTRTRWGTDR